MSKYKYSIYCLIISIVLFVFYLINSTKIDPLNFFDSPFFYVFTSSLVFFFLSVIIAIFTFFKKVK